jgi:hypothetical protein
MEVDFQRAQRDAAESRARQGEDIDLALSAAVPNSVHRLVEDGRGCGWRVAFRRDPHRDGAGTIVWEHPEDPVHNCSLAFPLPEDPSEQRAKENNIRMRIGWPQAA